MIEVKLNRIEKYKIIENLSRILKLNKRKTKKDNYVNNILN